MKNPWMSLWLSSANAVTGHALGQAASMGRKNMEVISTKAAEDMLAMWMTPWAPPRQRARRKPR